MSLVTKSSAAMYVTGASTITSNIASYFDEYQSMFTVAVSMITCFAFVMSVAINIYFRFRADRRAGELHIKAMEPKDNG